MRCSRSIRSLLAAAGVALTVAIPAAASALAPVTGSPAAVALAHEVVAQLRGRPAFAFRIIGHMYGCPLSHGVRYPTARRAPSRACRPATLLVEDNLRNGFVSRELRIFSAPGLPKLYDLSSPKGEWLTATNGPCWERLSGPRPFTFTPVSYAGERVSIAGRRGGTILLRGTGRWVRELDRIDARTRRVLSETGTERLTGIGWLAQSVRYSEPSRPFTFPAPKPVCTH